VASLIALPLALAAVVSHQFYFCFPIGMSMISVSAGFAVTEQWVKRRYAPALLPPEDGWWPTERK
jgi:hypothetical protein